jgi:hypothetical protein
MNNCTTAVGKLWRAPNSGDVDSLNVAGASDASGGVPAAGGAARRTSGAVGLVNVAKVVVELQLPAGRAGSGGLGQGHGRGWGWGTH